MSEDELYRRAALGDDPSWRAGEWKKWWVWDDAPRLVYRLLDAIRRI